MTMMPASEPSAAAVGDEDPSLSKRVADRYLKREVLGEGTYGVVFKAIDTKVGWNPPVPFSAPLFNYFSVEWIDWMVEIFL